MANTKVLLIIAGLVLVSTNDDEVVILIPTHTEMATPSGEAIPEHATTLALVGQTKWMTQDPLGDWVAVANGAGSPRLVHPSPSCLLISPVADPASFDPTSVVKPDCLEETRDCKPLFGRKKLAGTRVRLKGPWRLVPFAHDLVYQQRVFELNARSESPRLKRPGSNQPFESPMSGSLVFLADQGASLYHDKTPVGWETIAEPEKAVNAPEELTLESCTDVWGPEPDGFQLGYMKSTAPIQDPHTDEDWHHMLFGRLLKAGRVLVPVHIPTASTAPLPPLPQGKPTIATSAEKAKLALNPTGPLFERLHKIWTDPDRPWKCPARFVGELPEAWVAP